jgi:cytochrome c biogenesis protein
MLKHPNHSTSREIYELISSMRFAISLLTVLGIASIIGTVLKQNEPYTNYIIQLGQFWFRVFETLGLYDVYHSLWFLLILGFLVLSTSLCVYRNTPSMLKELRAWREHVTESSLRLFKHQAEHALAEPVEVAVPRLQQFLQAHGFRFRSVNQEGGVLLAAKAGSYHRLGYIFTHLAIVVICLGGLMDGNLPLKVQEMLGTKKLETRDIPISAVPAQSRLSTANLSFRGNMTIPEGGQGSVAFLQIRDGYLVQELPFAVQLKAFRIEHYATGQPKSFESDVLILDPERKQPLAATISVNHPLVYKGIAIYQSDFQDGGSSLSFAGWPLAGNETKPFKVDGKVFDHIRMDDGLTLELDSFRAFNVLNLSSDPKAKPHNVGPSATFKLRDTQGQAHEYLNYMNPVMLEGRPYLLSGMRSSPSEEYRYLRIPLDDEGSITGFVNWRRMMNDPAKVSTIASRYADRVLSKDVSATKGVRAQFEGSVTRLLHLFAEGGFNALAKFLEKAVPQAEREKAAMTYLRILEGAAFEAYTMSREAAGKSRQESDEAGLLFVRDGLTTLSDTFFYGAPFYLQMTDFKLRQASGLQLTRSPGKTLVYAGSLLLVLGIFAMFYIHERRVWLLVKPGQLLFAMSAARKSRDFDAEFARINTQLQQLASEKGVTS